MTPAGDRKHRVALQRRETTPSDYGDPEPAWTTYAERWASIKTLTGRELEQARQMHAEATSRITVPAAGLTGDLQVKAQHRVLYKGTRVYEVLWAADVDEAGEDMAILAVERT